MIEIQKFRKTLHFDDTIHFQNKNIDKLCSNPEAKIQASLSYYPQWEFPLENLKFGKRSEETYLNFSKTQIIL